MQPEPVTTPSEEQPEAADAAPVAADADEIDDLHHRLRVCQDRATRAAADLENLQKRFARELARGQAAERRRALGEWVASVDDLERALMHDNAGGSSDGESATVDGVRAVVTNAVAAISRLGYPRFGTEGDLFDAGIHEVVSTIPAVDGAPANTVVAVIKPGYGTLEDLLRPASVVVAKDAD